MDKLLETNPVPFQRRIKTPYMRLIVEDRESGMPADLCGQIFNPYFTTHQDGQGIGLGLAIVKEVVTDHDGVVTVESKPRQGSTFTVYLPQYSHSQAILSHPLSA